MFFIIVTVLVTIYAAVIEPKLMTTKDYPLTFDKINEQEADLVFFTGDLIDNAYTYEGDIEAISEVLSQIEAKYGKFAVWGNRDYGGGAEWIYLLNLKAPLRIKSVLS